MSNTESNIIQLGNLIKDQEKFSNPQVGRVYSINGISACLNTFGGGSENLKF